MALERAIQALACWYEPRPLFGVFERLRTRDPRAAAPALEYLGHVLPRSVFRPLSMRFEGPEQESETCMSLSEAIRMAWTSKDAWLRACAVRASRHAPELDVDALFRTDEDRHPIVRAELERLREARAERRAPHLRLVMGRSC